MVYKWRFVLEAVIPIETASGHGPGVEGDPELFLNDISPTIIGKPIFTGMRQ